MIGLKGQGYAIMMLLLCCSWQGGAVFSVNQSKVEFRSEAPLEIIIADSDKLTGLLDVSQNNFVFKIPLQSFHGFNTDLQEVHFNEKYMESNQFADAMFKGKVVDDVNLQIEGSHIVKVKGQMTIHGVTNDQVIQGTISRQRNKLVLHADFDLVLANYQVHVPRVVMQKIAPIIKVKVDATLQAK